MVGKMAFAGLRQRLSHIQSHDSSFHSEDSSTKVFNPVRRHVPFIASPLDPKTTEWIKKKHANSNLTLKRRPTVAQQEANRVSGGIFRKQNEASPLELFFDLFFVANLAIFGFNHSRATPSALGNYIGFFSLMWSFWFNVALHDVRFYVDSIMNRFLKLCQFAIWVAFTGLSPVYDAITSDGETRAFQGLALVFMTSRLIFMIQYGVVLWYCRPLKKTVVPLALMMLLYLCGAMAFLGTYLVGSDHELNGNEGTRRVNVWYAIIGIEAVVVIVISSIWRILSFKRTHLVERVGLLTLIIIGEGIIGIIQAISAILDGVEINIWESISRVVPGVFIIYLIFVLYFTPIAHDRFGTVRQQIWILMHYPLHVAILLTVGGSAQALVWSMVVAGRTYVMDAFPSLTEPSLGFDTIDALVNQINKTMNLVNDHYDFQSLEEVYDWIPDLESIQNLTSTYEYASAEFNEHASEIMSEMINETTNYFFENFQFEGADFIDNITDANEKVAAYVDGFTVVYTSFYICSGILLITLAAMYWVGKNNKSAEEWIAIVSRALIGIGLPFISIAAYNQPWDSGYMFVDASWLVSVVVFCYLAVSIVDNVVQNIFDRRLVRKVEAGELDSEKFDEQHRRRYNGAFGPSPHESSLTLSHSHTNEKARSMSGPTGRSSTTKAIRFEERSQSTPAGGPGEADSLVSHDPTLLNVDQLSVPSPPAPHPQQQQQQQRQERLPVDSDSDYHTAGPRYTMSSLSSSNGPRAGGYGRIGTAYPGYDMADVDIERDAATEDHFRNDRSFEEERMMSPVGLERPGEGYHRPEEDREH